MPSEDLAEITRSFAGIPDLLLEQKTLVAQAADMPVSKLFGVSPSGLNATGEFDERVWIGTYMAWRRQRIEPGLVRLVKIAAQTQGAVDLDNWGIEWHEVEVLTSREEAEIQEITARTDISRVGIGMPEEAILKHRYGGGDYNATPPLLDDAELQALEIHSELEATPVGEPLAAPSDEPVAPAEAAPGEAQAEPEEAVSPDTALNGAQVTALVGVIQQVVMGLLPRESAVAIITTAFPVDKPTAETILGSVGKTFKPEPVEGAAPMKVPSATTADALDQIEDIVLRHVKVTQDYWDNRLMCRKIRRD